ncbi:hypothetical protein GCM10010967_16700 [Dyadobacter beijingensis]|uniref:Secreted protein (Por secretion system target) n=1 Tax=Dyadobacter beijingensis TaxID=365489 RepID=A0ABQ2HMD5_9BACT|nr:T9SS type A sorting domain-containing protein [Dyadobacter beijingensis]GGM85347.1 hypothetical protein GCM10010967_16700 [Dyadobacter beijingensis]
MMQILLKRRPLWLLFLVFSCSNAFAQTYVGSVEFTNQNALNTWDPAIKNVTGNVYITSLASDVISSLAPLRNLKAIGGALIISENHSLTSLNGLGSLETAAAVEISFNGSLNDISSLGTLSSIAGPMNIVGNESLTNLNGLSATLTIAGDLTIRNNPALSLCNVWAICNYQRTHSEFTYLIVSGNAGSCTTETTLYRACNGPLPVVLTEFDALGEGRAVTLRWATSAETNASHFDIERSRDGRAWSVTGAVQAKGESTQLAQYTFRDDYPMAGENLYRLRMTDQDETFAYSRVRSVHILEAHAPAYPNPFSASLALSPAYSGASGTVELSDTRGNVIYTSRGLLPESIATQHWKPGIYVLRLTKPDGVSEQVRLVKAD